MTRIRLCAVSVVLCLTAELLACQPSPVALPSDRVVVGASAVRQVKVGDRPVGVAASGGFIYTANEGAKTLSVIDVLTEAVVHEVKIAECTPGFVRASLDRRHVLILDTARGELIVLDPSKQHAVLQTVPLGKGPDRLVVADDNNSVLVTFTGENKVLRLVFPLNRALVPVRQEFALDAPGEAQGRRRQIDSHGTWGVVSSPGQDQIHLLDLAQGTLVPLLGVQRAGPVGIGSTNGVADTVIVGSVVSNSITLIDLATLAEKTLTGVGLGPAEIVTDMELGRAYVTMADSNEVAIVDYRAKTLVGKLAVGRHPSAVVMAPPKPYEVWVASEDGISVIDGQAARIYGQVPVGRGKHAMTFWGTRGYVSNEDDATVSIIDRTLLR